ncbi:chorismate-binding protein [Hyunsoonleella sp. 2307UL5-6]|uniref:chorismate-binding protein n=1 Tax=Hyunsoonleella sp. 2307UL5-6 TaxID=3384768 RepID=UPI0039BD6625
MQDFFDCLAKQYSDNLPFVVYRKPNTSEIKAVLQNDDTIHVTNDFETTGFVFSPFDNAFETVILPLAHSKMLSTIYTFNHVDELLKDDIDALKSNKQAHVDLVKKAIEHIKTSDLQKVVVSRKEILDLEDINIFSIFKKLLASYKSAFTYCWYHPKVGLWLGATPETLLKIEGRHFSMMALAGTQDYKGTLNVEWQYKELQEQQFVTDFILDNIATSVSNITISDVETVKAGNLLHLRTLIKGHLNLQNLNLKKLLNNLHPTPAVCGLPKEKAKVFILKNENYLREFYTGFLGELNFDVNIKPRTGKRNIENRAYTIQKRSTQLYVNLRCMQIKDNTALVYVGGGITETSNPESEWLETISKSKVVKKVL